MSKKAVDSVCVCPNGPHSKAIKNVFDAEI